MQPPTLTPISSTHQVSSSFAWVNTQVLSQSLSNGQLDLPTALSQFSAISRDVLRILEDQSRAQTNSYNDLKTKGAKMEKLISDLSEKCQGMQQALLYKEEKYDEKCREVERYKLICELSARSAVEGDDGPNEPGAEENDFSVDDLLRRGRELSQFSEPDMIKREEHSVDLEPSSSRHGAKNVISHVKFVGTNEFDQVDQSRKTCMNPATEHELRQASDYLGGPSKAKPKNKFTVPRVRDYGVRKAMSSIGGINVEASRINRASVPATEHPKTAFASYNDSLSKIKLELTGQRNEVMSSSRNAVDQMRQKFTEKDLHRQLAGGCWTRMSSRRRKEWPF